MSRKVGQIITRGERRWLVHVSLGARSRNAQAHSLRLYRCLARVVRPPFSPDSIPSLTKVPSRFIQS